MLSLNFMVFLLDTPIYYPDNSLQTKFKVKGLMLCQTVIIQFNDNEQTNVSVYILFCTHMITNKSVAKAGSINSAYSYEKKIYKNYRSDEIPSQIFKYSSI